MDGLVLTTDDGTELVALRKVSPNRARTVSQSEERTLTCKCSRVFAASSSALWCAMRLRVVECTKLVCSMSNWRKSRDVASFNPYFCCLCRENFSSEFSVANGWSW